jgi:hypothetical protein
MRWDHCRDTIDPEFCRNFQKLGAGAAILLQTSIELASKSRMMTAAEIAAGALEGGQLYYLWPYVGTEPPYKDLMVVTKLDGDLFDRVLAVTNGAVGTLRRIRDQTPGSKKLECNAASSSFRDYELGDVSLQSVFYVSIGRPTNARMLPNNGTDWSVSMYVESQTSGSARLALTQGIKPPVGSNQEWIHFANMGGSDPTRAFHCMSPIAFGSLYGAKAYINNPDAALFVFTLPYLRAVFEEYAS